MPISEIRTKEYECTFCNHKWTNRVNGEEKPIPSKCARCKRSSWIGSQQARPDVISNADIPTLKPEKPDNVGLLLEIANIRIAELEEIETKRIAESGFKSASSLQSQCNENATNTQLQPSTNIYQRVEIEQENIRLKQLIKEQSQLELEIEWSLIRTIFQKAAGTIDKLLYLTVVDGKIVAWGTDKMRQTGKTS